MYTKTKVKAGLFGIGLDAYWEQFDGLKATDRLCKLGRRKYGGLRLQQRRCITTVWE